MKLSSRMVQREECAGWRGTSCRAKSKRPRRVVVTRSSASIASVGNPMHLVIRELIALRSRGLSCDAYALWRDATSRWPDFKIQYERALIGDERG